ncbi:MAG: sodium:solute symporter family protein [Syntrophorhabdaceae bacterium]|nr:sodium:solute symporter family protein [Syntrophorhabdaceae bacterium]
MQGIYLFTIFIYICLLWFTGAYVTRKSRSSEAYLVASRGLSVPFISVLVAGTWIGGVSIVGMAQGAYIHGISALWFQVGIWVAMFGTAFILPRILKDKKTYSILDVVGTLYDRKTARFAGIFQLVFSIWVVTMQIVGGGAILSVILNGQLSFTSGMLITAIVFTLYNALGGFVATAYTNLIHICAIVVGIFMGGIYVLFHSDAIAYMAGHPFYLKPFGDLGVIYALSWAYINFTLGVLAQPVINTASSARTLNEGRKGIIIGNLIAIPVVVMAALCGIAANKLFPHIPSLSALPVLLNAVPPYIAVFFLISMWAPLMSSGSPFLMGATTLAVKGYIAPIFNIDSDKRLLFISRITTLMIGAISFGLGFFVKEILREVTWIAVLLSAIVYIVFTGWIFKGIKSIYALIGLVGTAFILIVSFITGFYKYTHPIWPVTLFMGIVMFFGVISRTKE